MDERDFNLAADSMLARIEAAFENCATDLDFEIRPGGVIEVEFDNGSKIIINRHGPAREIWLAAKSGGFHFRIDEAGRWVGTRDGVELMEALSRCISEQAGVPVRL